MNFIQKKYFIFITILFISFSLFAQNKYQNKRIVVLTPTTEGFSSGEESWIPSAVRRKIEANFYDYFQEKTFLKTAFLLSYNH